MEASEVRARYDAVMARLAGSGSGQDVHTSDMEPALLRSGVVVHELGIDSLQAALEGQTKLLNLGGLALQNDDNRFLWAWCGHIFVRTMCRLPGGERHLDRERLTRAAIHMALADFPRGGPGEQGYSDAQAARFAYTHHAQAVIESRRLILLHLSFPVLEAMCRWYCQSYISPEGCVLQDFDVPWVGGTEIKYRASARNTRISNIGHELSLVDGVSEGSPLQDALRGVAQAVSQSNGHLEGFQSLLLARNSALHGDQAAERLGGSALNLALIVMLECVRHQFQQHADEVRGSYQFSAADGSRRPHWSFYPPAV